MALVAESLAFRRWALRMVSAVKSLNDFESNGFWTDGPDLVFDWLISGVRSSRALVWFVLVSLLEEATNNHL